MRHASKYSHGMEYLVDASNQSHMTKHTPMLALEDCLVRRTDFGQQTSAVHKVCDNVFGMLKRNI